MSWYSYKPYVPVAERKAKAQKLAKSLAKKGQGLSPVLTNGRKIASSFWGKSWCEHLETLSDYENRLPRGRTYARNGSILDLQISTGKVTALVMGSSLYKISVAIQPLPVERWGALKSQCAGKIDSLVGLLEGRLSDAVMRVMTERDTGLFPAIGDIEKSCSCPDWADLCKHLAAVLYGVGARLDTQPELLFVLRGVDHLDLLDAGVAEGALIPGESSLDAADLSGVFGIDIAEDAGGMPSPSMPIAKTSKTKAPSKTGKSISSRPAKKPVRKNSKASVPEKVMAKAKASGGRPKRVKPKRRAAGRKPAE